MPLPLPTYEQMDEAGRLEFDAIFEDTALVGDCMRFEQETLAEHTRWCSGCPICTPELGFDEF